MTIAQIKKLLKDFKSEHLGIKYLDDFFELHDTQRDYYRFYYELVKKYKFKNIVELGTCRGMSAAYFAAGNSSSKVITVDHCTDPGDDNNKQLIFEAVKQYPNIKFCEGWTCDQLYEEEKNLHSIKGQNAFPKVIKELNGAKIDLLFIDSWHNDTQAFKDWDAYKPYLKDGALVICDDISQGSPGGGIYNMLEGFWDKLDYDKHLDDTLMSYPIGFLKV